MPKLIISKDGLADYGALPKSLQNKVIELFAKFSEHTHAGVHKEKLKGARDPRVRTVRVDDGWRGIVMAPEKGDVFILHRVLDHDAADRWIANNRFEVNPATGALEVQDLAALDLVRDEVVGPSAEPAPEGLFSGIRNRELLTLGIAEEVLPLVDAITDDSQLAALCTVLPQSQADVLELLAAGFSVEDVWADVAAQAADHDTVDPDDLPAALVRPASQVDWFMAEGMDDLLDVLNQPFAAWRVFLHPDQRRLAERATYNGPVRVLGGPGTGKTVVAMHRAKVLAEQVVESGDRILFTTYTRNLADHIAQDLVLLAGPEILRHVEVINIDRLALRMVREADPTPPRIITDPDAEKLWQQLIDEHGWPFSASFLAQEWRQVVLAQGIASRDAYLRAARPGRGVRLTRPQRIEVWRAVEAFTNRLVGDGRRTYLQICDAAVGALADRPVKPYRHVIVDEAQDLHPSQWRLLRAMVPETTNDLFIVGDAHQRIYDAKVTLSRVGVNIRGRSHRLRLNYRTTREILRWSLGLLRGEPYDDLDGAADTLAGYRSDLRGAEPTLHGSAGRPAMLDALGEQVETWLADGVEPAAIGVAARTGSLCATVADALAGRGIATEQLTSSGAAERSGVAVGTMHRLKGLEFRCVAVVDVDAAHVPLPQAVTPASEDALEHERTLRQERSLLFVACTRARDDLWVGWSGTPSRFLTPMIDVDPTSTDRT